MCGGSPSFCSPLFPSLLSFVVVARLLTRGGIARFCGGGVARRGIGRRGIALHGRAAGLSRMFVAGRHSCIEIGRLVVFVSGASLPCPE